MSGQAIVSPLSAMMRGTVISSSETRLEALQLQSSAYGVPLTLVYGMARVAGNLLWYNAFKANPQTTSSGGGKGGVSQQSTSYTYTASVMLGLCEGTVVAVPRVWKGKAVYADASTTALAQLGLSLASGTLGQATWAYLSTNYAAQAIGYSGVAYVYAADYPLSNSASVDNHSFELQSTSAYAVAGVPDANPATIASDVLTNARYGAGYPAAKLVGLTAWSNYCLSANLLVSPVLATQTQAADVVNTLAQITNTAPIWTTAGLKMVPYGDTSISGNGATYTPNVTPVYDLTDDDFVPPSEGDDPIQVTRKPQSDAYNCVKVEFLNRANSYNIEVVTAQDSANIDAYGLRVAQTVQAHWICDATVAQNVAQLVLQRLLYVRNTYQFDLAWTRALLEPMDLVTLTDAALHYSKLAVRITEISESDSGYLSVTAEEYPQGIAHAATYASQASAGYQNNYNVDPGNVATPVVFEAPGQLTSNGLEIWVAVRGASQYWGGCNVWLSVDGTSYKRIGTAYSGMRYGTVSATVSAGTVGVVLNSGTPAPTLVSTTVNDAAALNTLCYIGGANPEYLAYTTAVLTSSLHYTLGTLVRGAYSSNGTTAHAVGDPFVRCDTGIIKSGLVDKSYVGKTVYLKLTSFNIFGISEQSIAAVSAYAYPVTGAWIANADVSVAATTANYGGISGTPPATIANSAVTLSSGGTLSGAGGGTIALGSLSGTLSSGQVPSGFLDATKFASGIEPVSIVSTVPSGKGTSAVFNSTDGKLYRWTGTTYTASVSGADIVANSITAGKIAAGAIGATQIAANSITALNIDSRGLSIKDASGNIILAAGSALDFSNVGGTTKPANNATNGANLVKKHIFTDGLSGGWINIIVYPSSIYGEAQTRSRDAFEDDNSFPITPGESIFGACNVYSYQSPTGGTFGLMIYDSNGSIITWLGIANYPAGADWTRYSGNQIIPANAVRAVPWFQINAFTVDGTLPYVAFTNLYIGRQQEGATSNQSDAITNAGISSAATTANWSSVSNIPYDKIYATDAASTLGFNPSFEAWNSTYPDNWSFWNGADPIKETTVFRSGTKAVKYIATGNNLGMVKYALWYSAPLPIGTFISGTIDLNIIARTSGLPGVLIRLVTSVNGDYTDTIVQPSASLNEWQRLPFTCRVNSAQQIYGMQIYVMGSWAGFASGVFTGTVVFDGITFAFFDGTIDNKAITISPTGTLSGIGTSGVVVDNSYISTGGNLCFNSDFSDGYYGWNVAYTNLASTDYRVGVNLSSEWTINNGTGEGTGVLYLNQYNNNPDGYTDLLSSPIVVQAGKRYIVSAYTAAHRCNVDVFCFYFDSTGALIGNDGAGNDQNYSAYTGGNLLSGYKRHMQALTAPSNAVAVKVALRKYGTISPHSDSYMFVARVMLEEASANAIQASPWKPSGVGKTLVTSISTAQNTATQAGISASNAQSTADTAVLAAADRLSKSSASTLSATVSINAVVGAGFRAGTLTWDSSGVRTGGYGVAMTPSGLVGYTSTGYSTFSISAIDGSATFSGSLNAATGSFSGSLTANAINAVNTINIANNAVTVPVTVIHPSASRVLPYNTLVSNIITFDMTPFGSSPTLIIFSPSIWHVFGDSSANDWKTQINITAKQNGVQKYFGNFGCNTTSDLYPVVMIPISSPNLGSVSIDMTFVMTGAVPSNATDYSYNLVTATTFMVGYKK